MAAGDFMDVSPLTEPTLRRLTADEVLRMVETGIIDPEEQVELIDGRLVEMSPEGFGHARSVAFLNRLLVEATTGMGLVVCRQVAQGHGGTIAVDNAPEGGAVFTVEIPLD